MDRKLHAQASVCVCVILNFKIKTKKSYSFAFFPSSYLTHILKLQNYFNSFFFFLDGQIQIIHRKIIKTFLASFIMTDYYDRIRKNYITCNYRLSKTVI